MYRTKTETGDGRETPFQGYRWLKAPLQKSEEKRCYRMFDESDFETVRTTERSYQQSRSFINQKSVDKNRPPQFLKQTNSQRNKSKEKVIENREIKVRLEIEKLERERMLFLSKKKGEEQKLKQKEEDLKIQKRAFQTLEQELIKRDNEVNERAHNLEEREREFEVLTRNIETQSDLLMRQKLEFIKELDLLNQKKDELKVEKNKIEKIQESLERIIQMQVELNVKMIKEGLKNKEETLEKKFQELTEGFEDLNKERILQDERERNLRVKELETKAESERVREETHLLNKEREEFIKALELAEEDIKRRGAELDKKEEILNARKEAYDEYDLNLMGMKLNEEVWKKRREIEVHNIQQELEKVKKKELELQKREKRLSRAEEATKSAPSKSSKGKSNHIRQESLEMVKKDLDKALEFDEIMTTQSSLTEKVEV